MTLSTNVDFSNCELGMEELDAVAGGNIFKDIGHAFSKAVNWLEHSSTGKNVVHAAEGAVIGEIISAIF